MRTPFDQRGLDTELLLTEPRVAVLPTDHRLAGRPELRRADLAGEPMPRWAGQADPAAAAYWAGADTPARPGPARRRAPACRRPRDQRHQPASGRRYARQRRRLRAGSVAHQQHSADLAFVPVSDLSPSEVVAAWPDTSRSRAVAGFVRAAAEVAASHAEQAAALA